jgi:hypothetical protein
MVVNDYFLGHSIDVELKGIDTGVVDFPSFEHIEDNIGVSLSEHLNSRPQVTVGNSTQLEVAHFEIASFENRQVVLEDLRCSVPFNPVEVVL